MPEEIWVSDITYIPCKSGFVYLSLITDAYSRKIVGYNLSRNLKAEGCIKAFTMAYNARIYPLRPLIHHSDRGVQQNKQYTEPFTYTIAKGPISVVN